ncbi:hypothetical protein VYU27_010043, partial [Nannochloropsis oceanica]
TPYEGMALTLLSLPVALDVISKFQEKSMQKMDETVAKFHSLYGALSVLGVACTPLIRSALGRK